MFPKVNLRHYSYLIFAIIIIAKLYLAHKSSDRMPFVFTIGTRLITGWIGNDEKMSFWCGTKTPTWKATEGGTLPQNWYNQVFYTKLKIYFAIIMLLWGQRLSQLIPIIFIPCLMTTCSSKHKFVPHVRPSL